MEELPFRDSREWLIGALVATGDMLGQMAAEDYPERLAGLYLEFREATVFSRLQNAGFALHKNLLDLLARDREILQWIRHADARSGVERRLQNPGRSAWQKPLHRSDSHQYFPGQSDGLFPGFRLP